MIPRAAEITRPPRRVGLEAAAPEHDAARGQLGEAVGAAHADSGHVAARVLDESCRGRRIAHLDAAPFRGLEPHARQAHAFQAGSDHRARRPLDGVAHLDARERHRGLHGDTLRRHPAHRVVRPADQNLRELGIGAPLGDAGQVGAKQRRRIRLHSGHEPRDVALGVRHEDAQVLRAVEGDAQEPAAVVRVAATQRSRSLLERHHALGAPLASGHRRCQGGIARAHHDDVVVGHSGSIHEDAVGPLLSLGPSRVP